MTKVIGNCFLEWKLDKVFTVMVDNASYNDVTVKEISKQLNMWKTNSMSEGKIVGPLECDDWVNVRNVIKFLEIFHELTEKVSGSRYVTSNCHFEDISELDNHLKACLASEDTSLSKMAERMEEKFKKYWGEPKKMNKMIFIAYVLDPLNKLEYVSFALKKIFGDEEGKKITAEVEAYMTSLFGEYQQIYSRGYHLQSSSSTYTSSNDTSNTSSGSGSMRKKSENKASIKETKEVTLMTLKS
ncbi:zinc finger BED domain-containing protein DAYSLEEPER-like [Nicotiana tomentosiformis]|uniref:zinc finger BED domain-containing protein DAYSLEEPER-like n=1 Tax=Nicotiana tomentosiformis TaxID=4098 RepID=UPI00388CB01A